MYDRLFRQQRLNDADAHIAQTMRQIEETEREAQRLGELGADATQAVRAAQAMRQSLAILIDYRDRLVREFRDGEHSEEP